MREKFLVSGEHLVCVHHGRMSFKYKQRSPKQSFQGGYIALIVANRVTQILIVGAIAQHAVR